MSSISTVETTTTTKRAPPPNQFRVDYAPTGRASCKKCLGTIAIGSVRLHRRVWSRFHDGYDTLFYHLRCGLQFISDIREITSYQSLRWDDVKKLAAKFSRVIDESHSKILEAKKHNTHIWDIVPLLLNLQKSILFSILDENKYFYNPHRLSPHDAAYRIADALVFGSLPDCPFCSTQALIQEGGLLRCCGYISGVTHCSFKYEFFSLFDDEEYIEEKNNEEIEKLIERNKLLVLPKETHRMPIFIKWKPPKELPSVKKFGRAYVFANSLNDLNEGQSKKCVNNESSAFDSEDDMEDEVEKGYELCGMAFSSVSVSTPPTQKLIQDINLHGGHYQDKVDGKVTYLLVGNIENAKETKKYETAIACGVPILHCSFIASLLTRINRTPNCTVKEITKILKNIETDGDKLPKGLQLRQRKFARYYKVAGTLLQKVPKVKEIIAMKKETQVKIEGHVLTTKKRNIRKGSALTKVDPSVRPKGGKIYLDKLNCAYNCCTSYTEIESGMNKFYNLQIIEFVKKNRRTYSLFKKWGRIGSTNPATNNHKTESYGTQLNKALVSFEKKFSELTGIKWDERSMMSQQPGRYNFVELDGYLSEDMDSTESPKKRKIVKPERKLDVVNQCSLEGRVQELISLVFDKKMMEKKLEEENLNLSKMPLGSISKRHLKDGYLILQEIQNMILGKENVENQEKHRIMLAGLTNQFYNTIPHTFSHFQASPVIDTLVKLKKKIDMMEQILEVSEAVTLMAEETLNARELHPLDFEYAKLRSDIVYVNEDDAIHKMISKMVQDTHASTHNTFILGVDSIYSIDRHEEAASFDKSIDNRVLLWHGSKMSNWVGILSNGLRIAPPEAPSSGYMFGKGIYFADMVSKSANYCFASTSDPYGIVLLCEVALGNQLMKLEADYEVVEYNEKHGYHSTWGIGKSMPDPSEDVFIPSEDGAKIRVPTGKQCSNDQNIQQALQKPEAGKEASLLYNEYIVYKLSQIRVRYIVKLKFNFKIISFGDD